MDRSLVAIGIVGIVNTTGGGTAIGFGFRSEAFELENQVGRLLVDAQDAVAARIGGELEIVDDTAACLGNAGIRVWELLYQRGIQCCRIIDPV